MPDFTTIVNEIEDESFRQFVRMIRIALPIWVAVIILTIWLGGPS